MPHCRHLRSGIVFINLCLCWITFRITRIIVTMATILTATEAAALSGMSYPTLRRKIGLGEIRAVRDGRDLEVSLADVLAYMAKSRGADGDTGDQVIV